MPTFEIVCLANSRKRHGRCVAGLRLDGKGWLRPIGSNAEGVLYPHHYMLPDDTEPQLGDVLRVHCSRPKPQPHHPEDWLVIALPWERVSGAAENNRQEWLRGYLSSGPRLLGSVGDRIAHSQVQAHPVAYSLSLIAPQTLQWQITVNKEGERRNRVAFTLDGAHYNLALTDPVWEPRLLHLKPGLHDREAARIDGEVEVWLTISLSEPFAPSEQDESFCYKLVVGVLVLTAEAGLTEGKSTNGRGSQTTDALRRQRTHTPLPVYAGTPDLTAYPDPFADDVPVTAVTEGRPTIGASAIPAEMLPHPPVTNPEIAVPQAEVVAIAPEDTPTKGNRRSRKRDLKQDSEVSQKADRKTQDKPNDRANGKWDNPQDKLLWQKQMARNRYMPVTVPLLWSEDEDALLLRLAADGETPEAIAAQVGRTLEGVYNRMEALKSGLDKQT